MRAAAILLCLKSLLAPATAAVLVYSIAMDLIPLCRIGLAMLGLCILLQILQVIAASRTFCPLCRTPVLAKKHCNKHRSARRLFGSYRLRVGVAALFTRSFRCPYCGEPSALEVRDSASRRGYSGTGYSGNRYPGS